MIVLIVVLSMMFFMFVRLVWLIGVDVLIWILRCRLLCFSRIVDGVLVVFW